MKPVALITGGSSNIGKHVAICIARLGFDVAIHYHSNLSAIVQVSEIANKSGAKILPLKYDLTSAEQSRKMVEETVAKLEKIDLLINTVGPFYYRDIFETTPDSWTEAIHMNLNVTFNVTHYALEHIIKSKGHIVNFTFAGIENPKSWPLSTAYCAAKAGLVVLTKTLASKLAPLGVRVNAIAPGIIQSESLTENELLETAKQLSMPIPSGRTGKPEEIAEVIKWLITESPGYVTGAFIPVAGSWEY